MYKGLLFLSTDVCFEVDDGSIRAHMALLSARCDVLLTMFTSEFSERSTGQVSFVRYCEFLGFKIDWPWVWLLIFFLPPTNFIKLVLLELRVLSAAEIISAFMLYFPAFVHRCRMVPNLIYVHMHRA